MASVSAVSICSNALLELGARPINDFDEATDHARLCSNLYPLVRDSLLRQHPWNCATKRVILSPSATKPAFGWANQFVLPGDHLRTLSVGNENQPPTNYAVEGGSILANTDALYLRYIWRNDNEASWDPGLLIVLQAQLLARLAYPVTTSTSLRDSLKQEAEYILRTAKAVDGQEEPPQELGGYPSYEARFR